MTEKRILHKIDIIPALFVKKREDGKYIVRCLLGIGGNTIQQRVFDAYALEDMVNPKYLLIGIQTGQGYLQTTFVQADEFEDVFKDKWKALIS
jgi:hypothetical protein